MQKDIKDVSNKTKHPLLKALQAIANSFADGVFAIIFEVWDLVYGSIKKIVVQFLKWTPNLFIYMLVAWVIYFFVKIIWITSSVL